MTDQDTPSMTPLNAYLLRALLQWIEDNHMTPHILVNCEVAGVKVPRASVRDGKIVLNMASSAIGKLDIGDHHVSFAARFGGHMFEVYLPMYAIISAYARETGQGMELPAISGDIPVQTSQTTSSSGASKADRRAHLKVVK